MDDVFAANSPFLLLPAVWDLSITDRFFLSRTDGSITDTLRAVAPMWERLPTELGNTIGDFLPQGDLLTVDAFTHRRRLYSPSKPKQLYDVVTYNNLVKPTRDFTRYRGMPP